MKDSLLEARELPDAERLAQLEDEYRQFVESAAHDLQAPLRAIAGFSTRLSERAADKLDAEEQRYLNIVVEGAGRMQALLQALVELSRLRSRPRVTLAVCIVDVVQRIADRCSGVEGVGRATVTWDALPTIQADPTQIQAVFDELVLNAAKFCSAGTPRVHISARRSGPDAGARVTDCGAATHRPGWIFSVRDNGIGVRAGDGELVFRPFKRLHARGAYPGVGLGLTVVRRIVEEHGGTIWCANAHPGSVFRFLLPDEVPPPSD